MTRFLGRIRLPNLSGAPSSPGAGEAWYDTALTRLRCRENGVDRNVRFNPGVPTTRAMVIGTAYQPGGTDVLWLSVPVVVSHGASGDGEMRLQISPDNIVAYTTIDTHGGAGIRDAVGTAGTDRGYLHGFLPVGWYYKTVSVTNNAAPTFAIGTALEQTV